MLWFPHQSLREAVRENSEWLTRKRVIDPMLKAAGWDVVRFSPGAPLDSLPKVCHYGI
jgi:hypothetical protein